MSDNSPNLALPYIQPSQAQKHVTHNEALRVLDVVTQLSVVDALGDTPPASPVDGVRYIVPVGGTSDWAGQDGSAPVCGGVCGAHAGRAGPAGGVLAHHSRWRSPGWPDLGAQYDRLIKLAAAHLGLGHVGWTPRPPRARRGDRCEAAGV